VAGHGVVDQNVDRPEALERNAYHRLDLSGLADIRGGLSLGFDEASWFSTVFTAAQMVVCLSAAWFSIVFGPRLLLLWSSAIFRVASALPPSQPRLKFPRPILSRSQSPNR
jgi:hypothetical protein